jgi:hypothetical protein
MGNPIDTSCEEGIPQPPQDPDLILLSDEDVEVNDDNS